MARSALLKDGFWRKMGRGRGERTDCGGGCFGHRDKRGRRQLGQGAGLWKREGLDPFKLCLGEASGRVLPDQTRKCRRRESLRPPPGAPPQRRWGKWEKQPPSRWVQHHRRSLSTQRGHDLQDPHSEEERDPGLCLSSCALAKPVMPMGIQGKPICSAQPRFGDLPTGTLP